MAYSEDVDYEFLENKVARYKPSIWHMIKLTFQLWQKRAQWKDEYEVIPAHKPAMGPYVLFGGELVPMGSGDHKTSIPATLHKPSYSTRLTITPDTLEVLKSIKHTPRRPARGTVQVGDEFYPFY